MVATAAIASRSPIAIAAAAFRLNQLRNAWNAARAAHATQTIQRILKPGGRPIGEKGKRPEVRVVRGGKDEARRLFKRLTRGGKPSQKPGYDGEGVEMPNGDWIGYRTDSKSGGPAIDLDVDGVDFTKIHFPE